MGPGHMPTRAPQEIDPKISGAWNFRKVIILEPDRQGSRPIWPQATVLVLTFGLWISFSYEPFSSVYASFSPLVPFFKLYKESYASFSRVYASFSRSV